MILLLLWLASSWLLAGVGIFWQGPWLALSSLRVGQFSWLEILRAQLAWALGPEAVMVWALRGALAWVEQVTEWGLPGPRAQERLVGRSLP